MTWPVVGGPARALGPEGWRGASAPLSSPVGSEGGEGRTRPAGRRRPTLYVWLWPPRIELGPRNACAHDSRPARAGESVWEWSVALDGRCGGWHGGSDCAGDVGLALLPRGRGGWADVESMTAQRSGSGRTVALTAGDSAWAWATEPSIQHGTPVARAPGLVVARRGAGGRRGELRRPISSWPWAWGRLPSGAGPPLARGEELWGSGRRSQ
jgi:hypothetical protein